MAKFCVVLCLIFTSCLPFDVDKDGPPICFHNNSYQDMYFYINCYEADGETYPSYDALPAERPVLFDCRAQEKCRVYYGPHVFQNDETMLHVYAFSADALEVHSWEEIVETGNYWMGEVIYKRNATIAFPDDFEYMGIVK